MKHNRAVALGALVLLAGAILSAQVPRSKDAPPASFKKLSTIVKLPDWLPGLGTLYVDPSTLPMGPYIGYNRAGQLVNVVYMIPITLFEQHKNVNDLGQALAPMGLRLDHTSVVYNPGHPGLPEPHYHVIEWLISPAQQQKEMNASAPRDPKPAAVVRMADDKLEFIPATVSIKAGQIVQWINGSHEVHNVTFNPSSATNSADVTLPKGVQPFESATLNPGQTYSHTFTTPGTYRYVCTFHEPQHMVGEVMVKP